MNEKNLLQGKALWWFSGHYSRESTNQESSGYKYKES